MVENSPWKPRRRPGRRVGPPVLLLSWFLAGCGGGPPTEPAPDSGETGLASYYATKFHGRKTASGEIYDETALTAAHRSLPFGTRVRVTRLSDGQSVSVRINDRGPFKDGRIIDLSRSAAETLGMLRAGVVRVRIDVLEIPDATRAARASGNR